MTADQLAALHALCFSSPRPWNAHEFDEMLALPNVYVCERLHGFLVARLAGPEVEILTLAVHPTARRTGVARELIAEFEKTAVGRGAEVAILEVSTDNVPAIGLYRGCGYTESGHRKDYYASPTGKRSTAIVMTRSLLISLSGE